MSSPGEFFEVVTPYDRNEQRKTLKQTHDGKASVTVKWEHVTGQDIHICYDMEELVQYLVALAKEGTYTFVNRVTFDKRAKVYSSGWRKENNPQWFEGMFPVMTAMERGTMQAIRSAVRLTEMEESWQNLPVS